MVYTPVDVTAFEQARGVDLITTQVGDEIKLFYPVTTASVPPEFVDLMSEKNSFATVMIDGIKYQSIYLGAEEANVMLADKLFVKPGDTIQGFFGNNVIVAGILPNTSTVLDQMHYVSANFTIKAQ